MVVSLGINLLVAGIVVGSIVAGPMRGGRPPSVEFVLGPFARALAPEDRLAIARDLYARSDLRAMDRRERHGDLTELAAALRAEPFDREAVEAVMSRQRDRVRGLETAVEAAVLDRLGRMSAEERAGFADRLEAEIGVRGHGGT